MSQFFALLMGIGALGAAFLFTRRASADSATNTLEAVPVIQKATDKRPRGIRNNNPTNIEDGGIPWRGRIGNDGRYVVFDTPENGLRAGYREIWDSIVNDGDNTIRTLVKQWAPPNENDTAAYQASVVRQTGLAVDQKLVYSRHAQPVLKAIVQHENGQNPYTQAQYDAAYAAAGKS